MHTITRRLPLAATAVAVAALGCLAALSLAPSALAWSPTNLPPGWTIEQIHAINARSCETSYRIWTAGRSDWSNPFCTDSPTYQADFDAWVDARYSPPPPPPQATTATPITVTIPTTTTTGAQQTTSTTQQPTSSTSDSTAAAPLPTLTDPATIVTTTVVTTVTTAAPDLAPAVTQLQDKLNEIAAQLAALTNRVSRLELAGDAAWVAYLKASANGSNAAAAATVARGTYLNAVYGLGAFSS